MLGQWRAYAINDEAEGKHFLAPPGALLRLIDEALDLRIRVAKVHALPEREWDESEADSAEARSARAYNHALAIVRSLLPDPSADAPSEASSGRRARVT